MSNVPESSIMIWMAPLMIPQKIYSIAGSEEQNPTMSTEELVLIKQAKRVPVERDTLYNVVKDYSLNEDKNQIAIEFEVSLN